MRDIADTIPSVRRSAGASESRKDCRFLFKLMTGVALLILAVSVIVLRLYRLTEIPPGIFVDEGTHGVNALRVLGGEHSVFYPRLHDGYEALLAYAVALFTSLFGRSVLAIRLPTALASAGAVFATFWLGYSLFGEDESGRATPWRGLLVGTIGAALLASSFGYTAIGRTVLRGNLLPGLLCLSIALLWQGWKPRPGRGEVWWQIALAGVCLGLVPYTYIASRFVPVMFFFFGLSFLLPLRSDTWQKVRAKLPRIALFIGAAALVAAPIFLYFVSHPDHFFLRSRHLWVMDQDRSQGEPLGAVLKNVWLHLQVFGIVGDPYRRHNFGSQPLLNPIEAIFFWFGVGMAFLGWRRPAYRLLLIWLGVMILPAILAQDDLVPNFLRMIGAAPAIFLLIGVGVWEVWRLAKHRYRAIRRREVSIAAAAMLCSFVLVQGVLTYRTYFHEWAAYPDLYELYESELTDAASVLNKQPAATDTVYLLPYRVNGHPGFEYLYHGAAAAHIVHANSSALAPRIEATLREAQGASVVKVLDWKNDSVYTGEGDDKLIALLSKYGRYVDSEEFTNFRVLTYSDVTLDRPWTFHEKLEPLTVQYDGGIVLLGVALGQGEEQRSLQEPFQLELNRSFWLGLRWQTRPGLETDFSVSLRLHGEDGALAYQMDAVLGNSDFARTSLWSEEEVDTLFHLELQDELPPGEYELRLIVYDSETLAPTVETEVWEPELVIARVHLGELQ